MKTENIYREVVKANVATNKLVTETLKSDNVDPVLAIEHCKAAMIQLREVYNKLNAEVLQYVTN